MVFQDGAAFRLGARVRPQRRNQKSEGGIRNQAVLWTCLPPPRAQGQDSLPWAPCLERDWPHVSLTWEREAGMVLRTGGLGYISQPNNCHTRN